MAATAKATETRRIPGSSQESNIFVCKKNMGTATENNQKLKINL